MDPQIKKSIAVSAAIFIVLAAYFGTYLPMRKSQIYIEAMRNGANIKTIKDFEDIFSPSLDYYSPIGQEELVRSTANNIANGLQSISDARALDELVKYISAYYAPIIKRGKGMSFGQDLYILGMMNEIAFVRTSNPTYLQAADKYFRTLQSLAPKRPQALYGLFDVNRFEGNTAEFKKIADQILSQWPDDARAKAILSQIISASSSVKK